MFQVNVVWKTKLLGQGLKMFETLVFRIPSNKWGNLIRDTYPCQTTPLFFKLSHLILKKKKKILDPQHVTRSSIKCDLTKLRCCVAVILTLIFFFTSYRYFRYLPVVQSGMFLLIDFVKAVTRLFTLS